MSKLYYLTNNVAEGKVDFDEMVKDEIIYNADSVKFGRIVDVIVLDKKTREGQPYEQIQLVIEGEDRKRYTKNWSVDFCRKYLNQLGVKAADLHHAMVVFKITEPKFKRLGMFMFCIIVEGENGHYISTEPFQEEGTDYSERLKKLGL